MIDNPRGPYSRIRWFCNDGVVLPPEPFACREHGGGRQHAEYSESRQRLASLGWSVGTIFAALEPGALTDVADRRQRLRELSLERYLIDIDDGWVLRRARNYRGRVQVETEEAVGAELLRELLADTDWVRGNYLLARESARVIPHVGGADDVARTVRRAAIELVDLDTSFEPLRAEIHGAPGPSTAARVRAWAEGKPMPANDAARVLADDLDLLYGTAGRQARLAQHRAGLESVAALRPLAEMLAAAGASAGRTRLEALAGLTIAVRETIESASTSGRVRLRLFDLSVDLEAELAASIGDALRHRPETRSDALGFALTIGRAAWGTGLLTATERDTLGAALLPLVADDASDIEPYLAAVDVLRRVPHWAAGSVRHAFAEPLVRYTALDARAAAFVDDLLRGSVLVGLGEVTRALSLDVAALTGVRRKIGDLDGVAAIGLNPGVARGTLRVFENDAALRAGDYGANDIVLLPETTPELRRVAGILTLGEGNPLSHVQLLARNFGIPNIAVTGDTLPAIEALRDREVVAAVAGDGSVLLAPSSALPPALAATLVPGTARRASLHVPPVDTAFAAPIPLDGLAADLSGRVVGPKAANLGELARLFPGRVAPALAIPFGLFESHMRAAGLRERLVEAYAAHRDGRLDDAALGSELAAIRTALGSIEIDAATRAALETAMRREFDESGNYRVFVRSDTNVEDLPEFTGAGLSETVPNVVGIENVLSVVPRVWASVLSPRAIEWRSNLLDNPESVYASVLLMQSVPSTKSGVLVTTNLVGPRDGLTVSAAWGVGGGVGGEATESLVLHPDGTSTLVSPAKSAYQRALATDGGLAWQPAPEGAVLTPAEQDALRRLADEVLERYTPVHDSEGRARPWDIEYGFVDGELTLFQIRPLVERSQQLADRVIDAVGGNVTGRATPVVDLEGRLCGGSEPC